MSIVKNTAIVVEGGAMRGIFAAGVLDSFLDKEFSPFESCYGVSAGATNLASYLTQQKGRSYRIITDYSCRPEFFSFRNYLTGGHYIDLDWLWAYAYQHDRLNAQQYARHPSKFLVTTTNVNTGEGTYTQPNADNFEDVLLASCAVPFAYRKFPEIANEPMTDGGVADSIPVIEAYKQGAKHILVVLSQKQGYKKTKSKTSWLLKSVLIKHPNLAMAMINRYIHYNQTMDFINNPPTDCKIEILRPADTFKVGRTTTDKTILDAGYKMGLEAGLKYIQTSLKYYSSAANIETKEAEDKYAV